jgi:hypothetical protein
MDAFMSDMIDVILAVSTLGLAGFTILLVIVTVLPYFSKVTNKLYKILNDYIFLHLSNLNDTRETSSDLEKLKLIVEIPGNTILFRTAVLHMKKDYPDMPRLITELEENLSKHNSNVDRFYTLVNNIIINKLRKPNYHDHPEIQTYIVIDNIRTTCHLIWHSAINELTGPIYYSNILSDEIDKKICSIG